MSQFIISARKYRPLKFKDVVGQEIITNSLENAISNGKLAQALLFTGPRGVGKTSCARIVAREINKFKIGLWAIITTVLNPNTLEINFFLICSIDAKYKSSSTNKLLSLSSQFKKIFS